MRLIPERVYFEENVSKYPLGADLLKHYTNVGVEMTQIDNHNNIPELRELPDSEFIKIKRYLILGIRKTTKLIPNNRSADFIVPFTSSGCSAMCLYCYLVCTFFKNSYLRVFVNREEMIEQVKRKAAKLGEEKTYEIGCNSDMVLENTITGNLKWAIQQFSEIKNARCTFATKFSEVDDLLNIKHNGNTQMRISVNPQDIIKKVEIGTASLKQRIDAANKMYNAGYRVGLNIAPIILMDNWKEQYNLMFDELCNALNPKLRSNTFFELIFMTYGLANETINKAALPGTLNIFEKQKMMPKGRGKYRYKHELFTEAEKYFYDKITALFPKASIDYIV